MLNYGFRLVRPASIFKDVGLSQLPRCVPYVNRFCKARILFKLLTLLPLQLNRSDKTQQCETQLLASRGDCKVCSKQRLGYADNCGLSMINGAPSMSDKTHFGNETRKQHEVRCAHPKREIGTRRVVTGSALHCQAGGHGMHIRRNSKQSHS